MSGNVARASRRAAFCPPPGCASGRRTGMLTPVEQWAYGGGPRRTRHEFMTRQGVHALRNWTSR